MSREFYSSQMLLRDIPGMKAIPQNLRVVIPYEVYEENSGKSGAIPFEPEKKKVLFGEADRGKAGSKDAITAFIKAHRLTPIIIMR